MPTSPVHPDPTSHTPTPLPQAANKPKLSPEEARKKAEEIIRLAKAKREKEEREQEVRARRR